MDIVTPTEIQQVALPKALTGQDFIAIAQTGSGKTLVYVLAIVMNLMEKPEARALVLSPSRETAEQVFQVFVKLCQELPLKISLAVTGMPLAKQANELKKNPRIVVATPGRINDHLKNNKLLLKGLQILVIDEADRMLDLGFGEQLKFIQSTLRGERQTLMFAANYGSWAESIAKLFMKSEAKTIRAHSVGVPVETLSQKVYFLMPTQKQNRLLDELRKMKGGVIVFADSQENCVTLGRLLEHHQFSSEFIHGNMNPGHRNRVLREFREEKIRILVTTDMLARGLDVPSIKYVVSYDLPYKGEEFLHRIGRTARAGRDGKAITFVTPTDGRTYRRLKKFLENAEQEYLSSHFKFEDHE